MTGDAPLHRVFGYLGKPLPHLWEDLCLQAFDFQYRRLPAIRRLCQEAGKRAQSIRRWQDIPLVPTLAFKTLKLHADPAREVFRSSGTRGSRRSVHYHPYPHLYRRTIDVGFPGRCLPGPGRWPFLSLIPGRELVQDSSLSFMADHVMQQFGGPSSRTAVDSRGVQVEEATIWARQHGQQADGSPVVILVTALALLEWLDWLSNTGEELSFHRDSVLFETGGFKGRQRETSRNDLVARTRELLGIEEQRIVREYGMTELTSQFYTRALAGGDPDLFQSLPWTRARILDPLTLERAEDGEVGLVALFDLANLGSALHILTEDLGVEEDGAFRLLGRASGAELRGCSLTAESLSSGDP